jgi:hypothetical protein
MRDFESPRLLEISMIRSASSSANAASFADRPADGESSKVSTVPPAFICRAASANCGWDGSSGYLTQLTAG